MRGVSLSLARLESEGFVALAMAGAALAQLPAFSRASRTALAASHSHLPVLCLRKRPASVPDAVIGHSQRFQPFLRSSCSLLWSCSG
jgi:hypothetical protein